MKKLLLSFLKFVAVFVPFYLIVGCFVPDMKAQMLEIGLWQSFMSALGRGTVMAVCLVGGTWLVDSLKNKRK